MALGERITATIAALHPLLALAALFGAILVAKLAGIAAAGFVDPRLAGPVSISLMTTVGAVFCIGYIVAIALHLLRMRGAATRVRPARIAVALLVMLAAYLIVSAFFLRLSPPTPGVAFVVNGAVLAWLVGIFFILWTAARGLVYAEEGRAVAFNRVVGTFFMFYFLPLGIYFLQRRVRRLTCEVENSPQAA